MIEHEVIQSIVKEKPNGTNTATVYKDQDKRHSFLPETKVIIMRAEDYYRMLNELNTKK